VLQIKPNCENCGKLLPGDSSEAMICSFECTFCNDCVVNVLHNVCPNCGGGFERRPVRPAYLLDKYPVSNKVNLKPVDQEKFRVLLAKYRDVDPGKR
jgi:hypothetical protein